jgi:hypothetical protein
MDQHLETIGAFFDGERVDADALRAALAIEEGRAYLVELAAMRELVAMPPVTVTAASPGRNAVPGTAWSARYLLAAAALVVIVGAGGFALGSSKASAQTAKASSAPEPTKILKLEPGVNWKDNESAKGGN